MVGGIGKIHTTIALTYVASLFPNFANFFINIGIAGSTTSDKPLGSVWEIHSIHDFATGWNLFPDCLYKTPWNSASLTTVDKPQYEKLPEMELVDMEGSGFFKTASFFVPTHKIFLFKVVSDYLEFQKCNPLFVRKWMEKMAEEFLPWLKNLIQEFRETKREAPYQLLLNEIQENLLLTVSQKEILKKALDRYWQHHGKTPEIPREFLYNPGEQKIKSLGKKKLSSLLEYLELKY